MRPAIDLTLGRLWASRWLGRAFIGEGAVGVAYFLAALGAVVLTRSGSGIALIWPASAIAAACLIRFRNLRCVPTGVAVFVGAVIANTAAAGDSLSVALPLACVRLAEVSLMTWAYRSRIRFPIPNITVAQAVHMTVIFGLLIPAFMAVPGGLIAHAAFNVPLNRTIWDWWLSHALGACLFGPPIILYGVPAVRRLVDRRFIAQNILLSLLCIASCCIALRYVRFPFAVMAVPLLLAAFSLGGFGTAVLSVLCALTLMGLWLFGVRPIGLEAYRHVVSLAELPIWALISTFMPPVAVGLGADERRKGHRALRSSERRFRESLAHSPIGMVIMDLEGVWTTTNAAMQRMLGYSAHEFAALPFGALTHPDDRQVLQNQLHRLRASEIAAYEAEWRYLHKNGSWIWARAAVSLVSDEEGRALHYIAQVESVETRRAAERALAEEQERLRITLGAIADAVITTDADRRITYLNAAAQEILGQTLADVATRRFTDVAALTDPISLKPAADILGQCIAQARVMRREACILHRPDGSVCYVADSVSPVFASDDRVMGSVIVLRDASAFQRARLLGVSAALLAIDLDRFKAINDAAGHAAGDAVLRQVGAALTALVRRSDTVARIGGDEFAIILEKCAPERVETVAKQVLRALNPLQTDWDGATHAIGASVGVAVVGDRFADESAWLAAADQACYEAKRAGRGRIAAA
ncbi:MAG: PAS domain S-box protein [Gammaproteobacteria bacterium]|nr:MAG: PAS domain S-box protein [Gammaproteobacteria bacterium]